MGLYDWILPIAFTGLGISVLGYFICLAFERRHLKRNRVVIKSKTLTETYLERVDMKCFKLGKLRLSIGDEIKLMLEEPDRTYRGKVLGIKKYREKLCLLTEDDRIMEFRVMHIKKLKIISRYGKMI